MWTRLSTLTAPLAVSMELDDEVLLLEPPDFYDTKRNDILKVDLELLLVVGGAARHGVSVIRPDGDYLAVDVRRGYAGSVATTHLAGVGSTIISVLLPPPPPPPRQLRRIAGI